MKICTTFDNIASFRIVVLEIKTNVYYCTLGPSVWGPFYAMWTEIHKCRQILLR